MSEKDEIIKRAKELGIDTSGWKTGDVITCGDLELEASSITVAGEQGVNRLPFKGTLFITDEPSARPPHGTGGKKLFISAATAKESLRTIIGMPVNARIQMDDHSQRQKIGVITEARIEGNRFIVAGHLFDKDFPREVNAIRLAAARGEAGMSLEATKTILEDYNHNGEIVARAVSLVFTGAAILLKSNAAYAFETNLAANSDPERRKKMEKVLEAINSMEKKLTDQLAAGIAAATQDILKQVDTKIEAAAKPPAKEGAGEKKTETSDDMKSLIASVETLTKEVTALKAGKQDDEVPPEVEKFLQAKGLKLMPAKEEEPKRKTATPELLARFGAQTKEGESGDVDVSAAIDTLAKKTGLSNVQTMAMKLEARKEGLIK